MFLIASAIFIKNTFYVLFLRIQAYTPRLSVLQTEVEPVWSPVKPCSLEICDSESCQIMELDQETTASIENARYDAIC